MKTLERGRISYTLVQDEGSLLWGSDDGEEELVGRSGAVSLFQVEAVDYNGSRDGQTQRLALPQLESRSQRPASDFELNFKSCPAINWIDSDISLPPVGRSITSLRELTSTLRTLSPARTISSSFSTPFTR